MELVTKYFFLAHIPITLLVDLSPLYPKTKLFAVTHWIKDFYVSTFNDPLVAGTSSPGGWFTSLICLEGVVQLPVCFFVLLQYARKRARTPLTRVIVIMYSAQVATATWACLFECLSFDASVVSITDKLYLMGFYLPYLIIPCAMLWYNAAQILSETTTDSSELAYLRDSIRRPTTSTKEVLKKKFMITGANSGVGFGIVQRIILQNAIALRRGDMNINLILTVRDQAKADSILARLAYEREMFRASLEIQFVFMDLTSMASIESAAQSVVALTKDRQLDTFICNAGMAQFLYLDLWKATIQFLKSPIESISRPNYKIQKLGGLSKDGIGATFQANFFGHYYLMHRLINEKILTASSVVIWMSSLEATADALKKGDIQGLTHRLAYESSKRVMDVNWFNSEDSAVPQYLVHPGLCSTNIVADMLPSCFGPLWTGVFYLARFCGSKFHVATARNGAYAATMIALKPESHDRSKKLGSASTWDAIPYVAETEFDSFSSAEQDAVNLEVTGLLTLWLNKLAK